MTKSSILRTLYQKMGLVMFGIAIHICGVNAQNSVGIGTATPNQNTVLELVAPDGNQGFLLPRLSTTQRTASSFTSTLSSNENGMIVYDSDLGQFFYWQTNQWIAGLGSFSDQAGGDLQGTFPNPIIRTDAVDSDKIADGSIVGADINNNSIGISKIDGQGNTSSVLTTDPAGNPQWIPQTTFATNDLPNGEVLIGDVANLAQSRPVTGDISLANDGTTTISPDAVGSVEIVDGAVTSNDIATNAVGRTHISDGAVTTAEILDGSITGQDIANETISSAKIIDRTIQTDDIASGGNSKVLITTAAGTVFWENISLFETSSLPEGNIFLGDVSNNAAPLNARGDGRILIGDGTTVNSEGITGDVTLDNSGDIQLKANAVGSNEIADNAVANTEIADDAVDTQKIDGEGNTNAVLTTDGLGNPQWEPKTFLDSNLSNGQVFIGDAGNQAQAQNVTGDISLSNTGDAQLNNDVVGTNEIIDNSITVDDIGPNAVSSSELADNSVDAGAIQNNIVSTAKVDSEGNTNSVLTTDGGGNPQWESKASLSDADADPNNEIQDLSIAGNSLSLSGDATPVDLSGYLDNTDAQDLSLAGTTLSLTGDGTAVDLSGLAGTDSQDLSLAGNTLSLTNDGTPVDLSGYINTDGQDLSLAGNTLSLTNDGTPVDLTGYLDNTDSQDLSLAGTTLSLTGDGTTVDLSGLVGTDSQDLSLAGNTLSLTNDGTPVDLSGYINTDAQDLSLAGNTLSLTNDGTAVDLSGFLDNTDAQDLSLAGSTLSLTGDGTSVDLSGFTNTDAQDLSLAGNTLSLTNDGTPVDLTGYLDNTDAQDLSLAGNTLSLSGDGTPVDLSGFTNTDAQDLSLAGNTLSLTNDGTTVDLSGYLDNTDGQDLANVLGQGNDAGATRIVNVADPTNAQDVATKNYVDGISVVDADGDPTNEFQTISKAGNTVTLSNGGGSFTDAVDDADPNASNELQSLSKAGNTVTLSNGGGSFTDEVDDADANASNELQTISKAGNTVTLSNGGGSFTDAVDDADANASNELQTISKAGNTVTLSNGGGSFTDAVDDADASATNEIQNLSNVLSQGNDAGNVKITNVTNPTNPQDVATKSYIDAAAFGAIGLTDGNFLIGDGINMAQQRVISGDITISNTGVATIAPGAITAAEIGNNTITGSMIAPNTITSANIAAGTINSGDIENGTIATADLADGVVNSAKIADGTVATVDLDGEGNLDAVLTTDGLGNPQWESKSTIDADPNNELITAFTINGSDILTITENGTNHSVDLSTASAGNLSDRRLKKDIAPLLNSLETLKDLNGYTYYWKDKSKGNEEQIGVIAQEVEKLYPQLVITRKDGVKKVNYIGLIPILIEAMKEQQMMIERLLMAVDKKEIDTEQLKNTLKKQSELFKKQKKFLGQLQEENYHMRSDIELIKMSLGLEASSEK